MTYTTYERLIFRQLSDFTDKNNVLNENISAYWKGQSFTTPSYSRCQSKSYEAFGTKYNTARLKVTIEKLFSPLTMLLFLTPFKLISKYGSFILWSEVIKVFCFKRPLTSQRKKWIQPPTKNKNSISKCVQIQSKTYSMGNSKTKKYLSDNVFNTEVQYCGHIFTTPSGDWTAVRAKPLVGQRKRRV